MKYSQWVLPPCPEEVAQALLFRGMDALSAQVCAARGFACFEEVESFYSVREDRLHDPFLLEDMDKAVERIAAALETHESIAIYGDYDVDGITSVCLLTGFLRMYGGNVRYYIPDRVEEGYGLHASALQKLFEEGVRLVITVDCGITALPEAKLCRELGLDLIVTDHHECREELPDALAVINPKRDGQYPFAQLAGVGVAFKLCSALLTELGDNRAQDLHKLLARYGDLVAIGTVADVMPMVDENRVLVRNGLNTAAKTQNQGLRALIREAGVKDRRFTSTVVGFALAPRLNAAGRMGNAAQAVELLLAEDNASAQLMAQGLCELNLLRQQKENEIFLQALDKIEEQYGTQLPPALVLAGENWQSGVVGIVASRLVERLHRPVYLISIEHDIGKGSARGVKGVNLVETLEHTAGLLLSYGGHELAAGFSLEAHLADTFRQQIESFVAERFSPDTHESELKLDVCVTASQLTLANAHSLAGLEPFGNGNLQPVFLLMGATLQAVAPIGGGRHLRLRLECEGITLGAVYFGMEPQLLGYGEGDVVDAAFTVEVNRFRDEESVQLQIRDIRLNESERKREEEERALYMRFCGGEKLTPGESQAMRPSRDEMIAVWKHLKTWNGAELAIRPEMLARQAMRAAGYPPALHKTLVTLDVLEELGLVHIKRAERIWCIAGIERQGKTDLGASKILRQLTVEN